MGKDNNTVKKADPFLEDTPADNSDGGIASCISGRTNKDFEDKSKEDLNIVKGTEYSEFYSMNYKFKGYLIIFAHSTFTVAKKLDRGGAGEDVRMLLQTFSGLNFKVDVRENFRRQELERFIEETTSRNFDDYASLAIAVSSHGDGNGCIFAKDSAYDPNVVLFDPFKKVESLYGKPKMFFLEYCRGNSVDSGVSVLSEIETDGRQLEEFKIPVEMDMLIVYGCVDGYIAFHNSVNGSQFFIHLCEALDELGSRRDLVTILTLANQKLAINFSSYIEDPKYAAFNNKKQCMQTINTLSKIILFNL